jgi:hypothetical protein
MTRAPFMGLGWPVKVQAGVAFEPFDLTAYGRLD